jgi:hypothetical protein
MRAENVFDEIGGRLLEHARDEAEFTKRDGVIDRMFPYVFQASRRMSTRAISTWLWESEKIKLSPTTIAKALRESERHWQAIYDDVEPAARIFADAHEVTEDEVLKDADCFEVQRRQIPHLNGSDPIAEQDELDSAERALARDWFGRLDEAARAACIAAVRVAERRAEKEEEGKGDETSSK